MSLFILLKIKRTRYRLDEKYVSAGTTGAVKVIEESNQWYAYRREGKKQIKIQLYTDKASSLSKLAKLNKALERGESGLADPQQRHRDRMLIEHLEEYIPVMRATGKSERDKDRKKAILRSFTAGLTTLADFTHETVDRYLAKLKGSTANKKKHLSAISIWVKWLLKKDRIDHNSLGRFVIPNGGKRTKSRRALTAEQIQTLLNAARTRPLASFEERYGIAPEEDVSAKLTRCGRERASLYRLFAFYGGKRMTRILVFTFVFQPRA